MFGKGCFGGFAEFLFGHVAKFRADGAGVAEGVGDLAVAVAPKLIRERQSDLGPGSNSLVEDWVGILDLKMKNDGRAAESLRC